MKRSSQSDEWRVEVRITILLSHCSIEIEQELRKDHAHVLSIYSASCVWHDMMRASHRILEPVERAKERKIPSMTVDPCARSRGTMDSHDSRIFFFYVDRCRIEIVS